MAAERNRVSLDPAAAAEVATDPLARAAYQSEIGRGLFDYQFWLDDQDRVRRIAYDVNTVPFTVDLDWGVEVDVQPRPAENVVPSRSCSPTADPGARQPPRVTPGGRGPR